MKYTETQLKIIASLQQLLADMGAQSDLLSIIGSWGDTLADEEILQMLNEFDSNKYEIVDTTPTT